MKNYRVINMCDYCTNEIISCNAHPVWSNMIPGLKDNLESLESVVACEKYENPVAALVGNL